MRREEFDIQDDALKLDFLAQCEYGTLSLVDAEKKPYGVPVNFACYQDGIVFHGAIEGKKHSLLAQNPYASFCVIRAYSLIPSYFSHTSLACPATQLFGSMLLEGKVRLIEDLEQKADALNVLMQKVQREGRYDVISRSNPAYTKMLNSVAVFYLPIEHSSFKLKLGQNLTQERKNLLIQELEKRATPLDQETLSLIKQYT